MSQLLEQVTTYARDNPGVVACACITVLLIGITQVVLKPGSSKGGKSAASASTTDGGVLTSEYAPFPLLEKREVSHNTRIFRFGLSSSSDVLGLPLGRHLSLRAEIDGAEVRRPYTPVSGVNERGYFELLVKVYPAPHGLMSRHLDSLRPGIDSIDVRGPLGRFNYTQNQFKELRMVCGGTGITPMWQVFMAILNDPLDTTNIRLVFANVNEDDILLRDELDELAETYPQRFSVYYVLNNPPNGEWDGGVGFVTKQILDEEFGPPQKDVQVLMCGPPPMNKAMKNILADMGYSDSQVFKF